MGLSLVINYIFCQYFQLIIGACYFKVYFAFISRSYVYKTTAELQTLEADALDTTIGPVEDLMGAAENPILDEQLQKL